MSIAYQTKAAAEKVGVVLDDDTKVVAKHYGSTNYPMGTVVAHHPKYNLIAFGVGAPAAFEQVKALIRIKTHDDSRIIQRDPADPFTIRVFNHNRSRVPYRGNATPTDALEEILKLDQAKKPWLGTKVPDDGGEAYKQGFVAGDNPHEEDSDEAGEWDAAFDEAADAEQEAEADAGGSVVKQTYRMRYAEAGHPNHSGDWLAVTLNNLVLGKTATDIEHFEELCNLNGVSLAKYGRVNNGWQGRLRMTGRNLLARVVFSTGVLQVPKSIQIDKVAEYRAPKEWLDAQTFRTKKAAADLAAGREKQAQSAQTDAAAQVAAIKKSKGRK